MTETKYIVSVALFPVVRWEIALKFTLRAEENNDLDYWQPYLFYVMQCVEFVMI